MSIRKIVALLQEEAKQYPLGAVELVHSTGAKVRRFAVEDGTSEADLGAEIWREACEDAEELYAGIESSYAIFVYDRESGTEYRRRKGFRCSAPSTSQTDLAPSEAPTESGLAAMAMRHQESTMRSLERLSIGALSEATARNAIVEEQVNKMRERELASMMLLRKAMLDQGDLEMRREQQRIDERRSSMGGTSSKDAVRNVSRKGRLVGHAAVL
jgi:hypothetical protein